MLKRKLILGIVFISLTSLQGCFVKDLISSEDNYEVYIFFEEDHSDDEEIICDPPIVIDPPSGGGNVTPAPEIIKVRKNRDDKNNRNHRGTSLRNSFGRNSNTNSDSNSTGRSKDRHERKHRR